MDTVTEHKIDAFAEKLARAQLGPLALFLIEAHRPLAGLLRQFLLGFEPMIAPLWGSERHKTALALLEDDEVLERLLEQIESRSH
jgi:hypothetical protein